MKYPGKFVSLHEEQANSGIFILYNWYHTEIGRGTLEELVPIIRAHDCSVKRALLAKEQAPIDQFLFNLDDFNDLDLDL